MSGCFNSDEVHEKETVLYIIINSLTERVRKLEDHCFLKEDQKTKGLTFYEYIQSLEIRIDFLEEEIDSLTDILT